ncbi:hypothetical protein F0L74_09140 [Chitinophaga agrisoli]|uniref:Caspase domain-containing protein n=1 Tax=Chitinophaga agrisoli TaxID=2607653 RepID=A0A5B2VSE0_9BACT|nr:caspase family protein [Chitinophaga agrisoli]KAA2242683.1 hypothetical protein F0L74_09140 [Chitinophaga agrisoli]
MDNGMNAVSVGSPFFKNSKAYLVAISRYASPHINNLSSPAKDVAALKNVLEEQHGFTIGPVDHCKDGKVFAISNPLLDCSGHTLLKFLSGIKAEHEDRLLFYFAGHGIAIDSNDRPEGFLLASNARAGQEKTFVKMNDIMSILGKLPCKHLLVILDCCYAGAFRWSERTRGLGTAAIPKTIYYERFEQYTKHNAWQVLTSSAHDQMAIDTLRLGKRESDGETDELSPFAQKLVNALKSGEADYSSEAIPKDGIITVAELCLYLENSVFQQLYSAGISREKRQAPMLFPLEKHDKGQFVFLNPKLQEENRIRLLHKTGRNPYKGLDAYAPGDNGLFYGRKRVIEDGWSVDSTYYPSLRKIITAHRIVVVTGPSGIGKSSLIRAGLLPLYKALGFDSWHEIRPGKKPYSTHAAFLVECGNDPQRRIILVDQYEELITECNNEKERNDFEQALAMLPDRHTVIVSIRSDFEAHFKEGFIAPVANRNGYHRFVVPPFARQELKEIVTQPAAQEVLEFKPLQAQDEKRSSEDFINRIVDEAHQQPGSLPLLSMALAELYAKKEGVNLLEAVYNQFSGISNIIERKATEAYETYQGNPRKQQLFRFLIYRMISLDGGEIAKRKIFTRYYTDQGNNETLNDLLFSDPDATATIQEIKIHLEKERLLNSGTDEKGNEYTEPAHDALLRSWPMLLNWLNEDPENTGRTEKNNLLLHEAIKDTAIEYYKETDPKRKNKYLWKTDPRLSLARRPEITARLNQIEHAFIEASYKAKVRGARRNIAIITAAFLVIGAVAVIAVIQAKIAQDTAARNKALYLASESDKYLPSDAIRLLEYAASLSPEETSVMQKLQMLTGFATDINLFTLANMEHPKQVMTADFNTSSRTLVSVCLEDSVARLWNLKGRMLAVLKPATPSEVKEAIFLHNKENNIVVLSGTEKTSYISIFSAGGTLLRENKIDGSLQHLSHSFSGAFLFGQPSVVIDMKNVRGALIPRILQGEAIYPYPASDSFIVKNDNRLQIYGPDVSMPAYSFLVDPELRYLTIDKFGYWMLLTSGEDSKGSTAQLLRLGDSIPVFDLRRDLSEIIIANTGDVNIFYKDSMFAFNEENKHTYVTTETDLSFYQSQAVGGSYITVLNTQDEYGNKLSDEDLTTTIGLGDHFRKIRYNGVFFASFDSLDAKKLSYDRNVIRYWDFNERAFESRFFGPTETRLAKYVDGGKKKYVFSNIDEDADSVICSISDEQSYHELYLSGSYLVIEKFPLFFAIDEDSCLQFEFRNNQFERISQTVTGRALDYRKLAGNNRFFYGIADSNRIIRLSLPDGKTDSFTINKKTIINDYYEMAGREDQLFVIDSSGNCFICSRQGKTEKFDIPNEPGRKVRQSDDHRFLSFTLRRGVLLLDLSDLTSKLVAIKNEEIFDASFFPTSNRMLICTRNYNNYLYNIAGDKLRFFYTKEFISAGDYVSLRLNDSFSANEVFFSQNGNAFILKSENRCSLFDGDGKKLVDYDLSLLNNAVFVSLSETGEKFIAMTDDNVTREIYTPAGILAWLKHANIPPLSKKLRDQYDLPLPEKKP